MTLFFIFCLRSIQSYIEQIQFIHTHSVGMNDFVGENKYIPKECNSILKIHNNKEDQLDEIYSIPLFTM